MLTNKQKSLLNFIKREQQKAGTKKLKGKEGPMEFTVSASMLFKALQEAHFETSTTEAIGVLHELIALKIGIRLMKSVMCKGLNGVQEPGFMLRYSPPVKERMKAWRQEQKRLGRTVRTFYLTDDENAVVQECIERLRSA